MGDSLHCILDAYVIYVHWISFISARLMIQIYFGIYMKFKLSMSLMKSSNCHAVIEIESSNFHKQGKQSFVHLKFWFKCSNRDLTCDSVVIGRCCNTTFFWKFVTFTTKVVILSMLSTFPTKPIPPRWPFQLKDHNKMGFVVEIMQCALTVKWIIWQYIWGTMKKVHSKTSKSWYSSLFGVAQCTSFAFYKDTSKIQLLTYPTQAIWFAKLIYWKNYMMGYRMSSIKETSVVVLNVISEEADEA